MVSFVDIVYRDGLKVCLGRGAELGMGLELRIGLRRV